MKIFFSVGEPSGDLHGANLIQELRRACPNFEAVGYGGPRMADAGCTLNGDLTRLAVMGLGPVLAHIPKFWTLATEADRQFRHQRPDAVVLIDYPGFNWWIARRAKAHGIPVVYYGVPQLWAWASWRVKKMRRLVDHVLCKLPFEERWYRQRGCHSHFVGHPYFDELRAQELDEQFLEQQRSQDGRLVTILPGSRTQEVKSNMECFTRAAERVKAAVPDARFAVACFKHKHIEIVQQFIDTATVPIDVLVGRTPELIQLADCCMACSGSVSLEMLYREKPSVIHYRVSRPTAWLFRRLIKVRFMTLVNLLAVDNPFCDQPQAYDPSSPDADEIPFPEYPTYEDRSQQVADHLIDWLTNEDERQRRIAQLAELKGQIADGGASRRVAQYLVRNLSPAPPTVPRPHFIASPMPAADVAATNLSGKNHLQ
jgi:lipid-A-disaccharide synthase